MKLPRNPLTEEEFRQAKIAFLQECEKKDGNLVHTGCGGAIRQGFYDCFEVAPDGSLKPGPDGFGLGPQRVPYCDRCDEPDGFRHTYAVRVGIIPEPKP